MPESANGAGQSTGVPTNKVIAGGLAGAITTIIVFVLNNYVLRPHQLTELDGTVSAAITTFLSFVVSYLIPPGRNETVK